MQPEELFALVFVVGMFTGVFIVFMGLRQRSQQLEMRHRERMAMIERGQIPLAEPSGASSYAQRLDASAARVVALPVARYHRRRPRPRDDDHHRHCRRLREVGIGVGGAVAILGGAFIVRSLVVSGAGATSRPVPPLPPARSSDDAL